VIGLREQMRPDAREIRACALAALAECGVVYLPLHLMLTESRGVSFSLVGYALPFAAAYVGATVLACWFRSSSTLATSAAVVAVLVGLAVGHGDVNTSVFALALALVVGFRVVTLGIRDWRTPLHAEIGWFAVALGFEAVIASGGEPGWRPLLVVLVPVFFVSSLASRASTVWTSGGVHDLDEHVRAAWIRRAVVATLALVGAMAAAVVLSVRGGLFDRIGSALTPFANAVASFVAWVLGQAARPFFWLVDRLGIDPQAVRDFFARLRRGGLGRRLEEQAQRPGAALWQRLLGLAVFLGIAFALYRLIRRARPILSPDERPGPAIDTFGSTLPDDGAPSGPGRFRRELPADAVRRWYAETLLALELRGIVKEPSVTPSEFAPDVADAYPAGREAFLELTHAYEDVRYGSLRLDRAELTALERGTKSLLATIRRDEPLRHLAPER
jgi:Domain of unknown function (DUF4129)